MNRQRGDRFTSGSFISKHPDVNTLRFASHLKKKRNLSLLRWLKGKFQGKVKRPKDVFRAWIPADEHHLLQDLGVQHGNHIISYHFISSHNPNDPNDPKRLQYSSHSTSHIPIYACRSACWLGDEVPGAAGPHHALGHVATSMESATPMARGELPTCSPPSKGLGSTKVMSNQINQ